MEKDCRENEGIVLVSMTRASLQIVSTRRMKESMRNGVRKLKEIILSILCLSVSAFTNNVVYIQDSDHIQKKIDSVFANADTAGLQSWLNEGGQNQIRNVQKVIDFNSNTIELKASLIIPSGGNVTFRNGTIKATESFPTDFLVKSIASTRRTSQNVKFENILFNCNYKSGGLLFNNFQTLYIDYCTFTSMANGMWAVQLGSSSGGESNHPVLDHDNVWNNLSACPHKNGIFKRIPKLNAFEVPNPNDGPDGIWISSNATDGCFSELNIWGCHIGLKLSSPDNRFSNLHFSVCTFGLYIDGDGHDPRCSFNQCDFDDGSVFIYNAKLITFDNCVFRSPQNLLSVTYPFIKIHTWTKYHVVEDFSIINSRFEGMSGKPPLTIDGMPAFGKGNIIQNNHYSPDLLPIRSF